MPELPDLTVFASNLNTILKNKEVKSIEFFNTKRLNVTREELQKFINNTTIHEIRRSGKEIEFIFSNDISLFVHLMLTGGFYIVRDIQNIKFKIIALTFSDGNSLVINDPKGLVTLKLNPVVNNVPDALDIDSDYLKKKILEKPKMSIKAFLIDQKIIRGIGNAYADEILWEAKISPKSIVGKLPDEVINYLSKTITKVLLEAIEQIKKINPGIISGEIREFLSVHNPRRRESPNGYPIIKEKIASKTTYYTEEQVLYG